LSLLYFNRTHPKNVIKKELTLNSILLTFLQNSRCKALIIIGFTQKKNSLYLFSSMFLFNMLDCDLVILKIFHGKTVILKSKK